MYDGTDNHLKNINELLLKMMKQRGIVPEICSSKQECIVSESQEIIDEEMGSLRSENAEPEIEELIEGTKESKNQGTRESSYDYMMEMHMTKPMGNLSRRGEHLNNFKVDGSATPENKIVISDKECIEEHVNEATGFMGKPLILIQRFDEERKVKLDSECFFLEFMGQISAIMPMRCGIRLGLTFGITHSHDHAAADLVLPHLTIATTSNGNFGSLRSEKCVLLFDPGGYLGDVVSLPSLLASTELLPRSSVP